MGDTAQSRMHASRPAYDPHCLQRHVFQELSSEPSSATMNGFVARLVDLENNPILCVFVEHLVPNTIRLMHTYPTSVSSCHHRYEEERCHRLNYFCGLPRALGDQAGFSQIYAYMI